MEAIKRAGDILKKGGLVAFPTETVYGLGANALDPEASRKIYAAKGRPSDNPLIVHIADLKDLPYLVKHIPEKAQILAKAFWPGPLTMIFLKSEIVPMETTGGLDSVAVRFPSSRIARELILSGGRYIAAPSANRSGRPSPTNAAHVAEDLGDSVDMILDGGECEVGLESTIVDFTEEVPVVLRPGYISLSMLEEVIGTVKMDKGLISADSSVHPKAPGMKYRHYAPKAELIVVEGEEEDVVQAISRMASKALQKGQIPGIIASEETFSRYREGLVQCIGSRKDEKSIAKHLYNVLRSFDDSKADVIYSEAFYTPKMGQAIMNRLLKAAGHRIIQAKEEREMSTEEKLPEETGSNEMIAIGSDHGGFELKEEIKKHLEERGLKYKDFGTDSTAATDYTIYGKKVARAVLDGECSKGILICGTGIGISITANRFPGIRAALCSDCFSAEATRLHNDANILAMGGRVVGPGLAVKIVDTFLDTPFSNEERHKRRVRQIDED